MSNYNKFFPFLIGAVLATNTLVCQAADFTIQTSSPRQTIRHFGASDAWSMQFIGLWENEAEQQKIADWLFSTKNDAQGKPLGILSGDLILERVARSKARRRRYNQVHVQSAS